MLAQLAQRHSASETPQITYEGASEVTVDQRRLLCDFMDYLWTITESAATGSIPQTNKQTGSGGPRIDMRARVTQDTMRQLLASLDAESAASVMEYLVNIHGQSTAAFALRVSRAGPTPDRFIDWHVDGGYATRTVQVRLSEEKEYEGGDLLYYAEGGVVKYPQPAGALLCHDRDALHAVTAMHRGTRKSLFVVDHSNGLGGEGKHWYR